MSAINHVPTIDHKQSATGCCSLIDPAEWNLKEFDFDDKLFVRVSTRSLFHIPLNFSSVMRKAQASIFDADADSYEPLVLTREVSPWRAEHYIAVSHEVPEMETARMSGKYMTQVFEGPFKDAGRWRDQLIKQAEARGWRPVDVLFFYTECPSCAKQYGKNYVVGFVKIKRLQVKEE